MGEQAKSIEFERHRHTDEIQEIVTKLPSWIVRWGIVFVGGILLMALSVSAIIRYPDTIKLPLKIQTTDNPAKTFALVEITQDSFTKIKVGQQVIVYLKAYSSDIYAPIKGMVDNVPDNPNEKGLFTIRIKLNETDVKSPIKLKNWMTGSAEIITQDITVLQRVTKELTKRIN